MTTANAPHRRGLSATALKLIAAAAMLIDHVGLGIWRRLPGLGYLVPQVIDRETWWFIYQIMRDVGRIAFPVFCFLLVEGFGHTRSRLRYATRLLVFALISQWPFQAAFSGFAVGRNIFFTLFLAFLMLWALDGVGKRIARVFAPHGGPGLDGQSRQSPWRARLLMAAYVAVTAAIIAAASFAAEWLDTDYGMVGIILIATLHVFGSWKWLAMALGFLVMQFRMPEWELSWRLAYWPGFALPFIYNGRRGLGLKYFFYVFYPAHLAIIYLFWNYISV